MYTRCSVSYFILILQLYGTELRQMKNGALRVIGGRNAIKGEFPYVMRMQVQVGEGREYNFFHLCTCSLLSPAWSLTAAHCIDGLTTTINKYPETKGVLRHDLSSAQETDTSLILHSVKYSAFLENLPSRVCNDIGLLRSQEVPLWTYAKLSSVDYSTLFGHQALALGYGWSMGAERINHSNNSLQVLDVITVKCSTMSSKIFIPSLCLKGLCGRWSAICPGDSGGPVLHPSGIVGVNTAVDSRNCNKELSMLPTFKLTTNAGIVTPVSPFLDWIAKIVQKL